MLEASAKLGAPINSAVTVKKIMEEAGYVDVVEVVYKWPSNRWPANKRMKEIGTHPFKRPVMALEQRLIPQAYRRMG